MQAKLEFDDGKYTLILHDNYSMDALRYGEPWRDLTGDNLVYCMLAEILRLQEQLDAKEPK